MKKLEKRAIICLTLAAVLFAGTCVFTYRFVTEGGDWATFYANRHVYEEGRLAIGEIYDRNGVFLAGNGGGKVKYNEDSGIRRATVHAVGDMDGNIGTSALSAFKSKIVGYNLVTGTYSVTGKGNSLALSIDAEACRAAYKALKGRNGAVGVYNYKTGEIVCMVSGPGFDPADPPRVAENDTSGIYINKFLSSRFIPGSVFKLVTSAAAIETLPHMDTWTAVCGGSAYINGEKLACTAVHGTVDFESALAESCNCAFAQLSMEIGSSAMEEYVNKCGLTVPYNIDGIKTAMGSFEFPSDAPFNLSWAGIGQYNDLVNPCSLMVYMGAIANGGKAPIPKLLYQKHPSPEMTGRMINTETADKLASMMKNNVESNYGAYNFPGLDIYAKSGTAEVRGKRPNAWFAGFVRNEGKPYAFVVLVENGGYGSSVAGPVANSVLQELVNK